MFPAGFWSRERVRRFALQLEGERWASAWPPLTARSRRPRTKPLANDDPPVASDIGIFLRCLAICDRRLRVQRRSVIYAARTAAVKGILLGVDGKSYAGSGTPLRRARDTATSDTCRTPHRPLRPHSPGALSVGCLRATGFRRRAPAARAGSGHDADVQPRNHLAVHQAGRERDLPIRRQQGPVDDRFAAPRAAPTAREGDLLTGPDDVVFHRTGLHPSSHADLTTTRQRELARQEGGIGPRSDPAFS